MTGITRRALLASVNLPLVGCALEQNGGHSERAFSRKPWAAPRVSSESVIRKIVGHRPFRPSGFVVDAQQFDDTLVIHNYGHGGGGISLAWGSSALALRELKDSRPGQAAVIGSGVMGLTTARLLQDAGWDTTIYTRDVARHTTSRIAGGQWAPFSVYAPGQATEVFKSRLLWAAKISHHAYTSLGGAGYGVRWMEQYALAEEPAGPLSEIEQLFAYTADLEPGQHPFGNFHARRSVTMMIEPAILLSRLTQDFHLAGGRLVIKNFSDLSEVLALSEQVVFNCSGLGAAELFGDTELVPAKGQLVLLPPDPAIDYITMGGGDGILYMFPRSDVLLLGGTFEVNDYTSHPDPGETERIIAGHRRLYAGFGNRHG